MSLPIIVGLAGFPGSGREEVAAVLVEEGGYVRAAFADAAERECAAWLGLTVEDFRVRSGEFRPMLERRVAAQREKFPGYWRNYLGERLRPSARARFIVPDVACAKDAEFLQGLGGVIVRVVKDSKVNPKFNVIEIAAAGVSYDHYVDGRGREHLRAQARDLLRRWGLRD